MPLSPTNVQCPSPPATKPPPENRRGTQAQRDPPKDTKIHDTMVQWYLRQSTLTNGTHHRHRTNLERSPAHVTCHHHANAIANAHIRHPAHSQERERTPLTAWWTCAPPPPGGIQDCTYNAVRLHTAHRKRSQITTETHAIPSPLPLSLSAYFPIPSHDQKSNLSIAQSLSILSLPACPSEEKCRGGWRDARHTHRIDDTHNTWEHKMYSNICCPARYAFLPLLHLLLTYSAFLTPSANLTGPSTAPAADPISPSPHPPH